MKGIIVKVFLLVCLNFQLIGGDDYNIISNDYTPVQCYNEWDPKPCGCYVQSSSTAVICKNISSEQELSAVFASLPKVTAFTDFILRGGKIQILSSGIFGLAKFMGFEFIDTALKSVENGAFEGSEETATGIAFLKNQIEHFNFECLRPLKNLAMFTMSSEKLRTIPDNAFANFSKLAVINIVRNKITTIGNYAFANLTNIHHIVITGNQETLESIGDYAFYNPAAQFFERLVLSSNNLSDVSLSSYVFVGANVTFVDLQENHLTMLKEDIFNPLLTTMADKQNGLIMGFGNPIQCNEDLRWLINKPMKIKRLLIGFECDDQKYITELTEKDLDI